MTAQKGPTPASKLPKIDLGDNLGPALGEDDEDEPSQEFRPAVVKTAAARETEKYVWIILEDNDDIPPSGQYIGVNGKGYMLQAGVEARVPVSVLGVLDAAIKSVPVKDPNTLRVIGYRNRLRFPYRRLTKADMTDEQGRRLTPA